MNTQLHAILYSFNLSNMTDQELFDECMEELYGDVRFDKQGCLIHELMERLEAKCEAIE